MVSIARDTGVVPPALKKRTYLEEPFLIEVYSGFCFLSQGRRMGFSSPDPIQLTEVLAYCEFLGIRDEDDLEEFVWYVRQMDVEYLEWYRDRPQE